MKWCSWIAAAAYEGYQSDISRTMVMGEASKQHRSVFRDLVRHGQQIAFETVKVGTPAGAADDAVRAAYVKRAMVRGTSCRVRRIEPVTASASTSTNRSISCMARRGAWRRNVLLR